MHRHLTSELYTAIKHTEILRSQNSALLLEYSWLTSYYRVEQMAVKNFNMHVPDTTEIVEMKSLK